MATAPGSETLHPSPNTIHHGERIRPSKGFLPEIRAYFSESKRKLTPILAEHLLRAAIAYRNLDHLELAKITSSLEELYPGENWNWLQTACAEIFLQSPTERPVVRTFELDSFIQAKLSQLSAKPEYASQLAHVELQSDAPIYRKLENALTQWAAIANSVTTLDEDSEIVWQITDPIQQATILQTIYSINTYVLSMLRGNEQQQAKIWGTILRLPDGYDVAALLPIPGVTLDRSREPDTRYQLRIFSHMNQLTSQFDKLAVGTIHHDEYRALLKLMEQHWNSTLNPETIRRNQELQRSGQDQWVQKTEVSEVLLEAPELSYGFAQFLHYYCEGDIDWMAERINVMRQEFPQHFAVSEENEEVTTVPLGSILEKLLAQAKHARRISEPIPRLHPADLMWAYGRLLEQSGAPFEAAINTDGQKEMRKPYTQRTLRNGLSAVLPIMYDEIEIPEELETSYVALSDALKADSVGVAQELFKTIVHESQPLMIDFTIVSSDEAWALTHSLQRQLMALGVTARVQYTTLYAADMTLLSSDGTHELMVKMVTASEEEINQFDPVQVIVKYYIRKTR